MKEPIWIREDLVLAVHLRQIAEHGGTPEIRDQGLLSSALARPINLFSYNRDDTDLAALAAAYAHGIIKNHPFADGNKRAAYVVCLTFLKLNGAEFEAEQSGKYSVFLKLASGEISEAEFAKWIREHLKN